MYSHLVHLPFLQALHSLLITAFRFIVVAWASKQTYARRSPSSLNITNRRCSTCPMTCQNQICRSINVTWMMRSYSLPPCWMVNWSCFSLHMLPCAVHTPRSGHCWKLEEYLCWVMASMALHANSGRCSTTRSEWCCSVPAVSGMARMKSVGLLPAYCLHACPCLC